ncbi:ABC transporter ATP-binding protein [Micromonospora maritima]|uniref:ABC transporter ATP-binding protein n=1 Tax=Micromonospora maritima TaxID=986711 RepID=UPI00157E136D|nr:ABC transporter ATP-binding protein [Micromonospora maritima]
MYAIEADNLHRTYRTSSGWIRRTRRTITAVDGVSFQVPPGELFGLLGPNGAGKTTTIKILNTLLLPTGGTARIHGLDVTRHTAEVRRRIGYVFGGDRGLYDRLSALDNLRYFAELYEVDPRVQRRRIEELLELVGLTGRQKERVEGYSRGMKQRLHIARGLLHDPDVIFLDEPTLGVDPVAARDLRAMIAELVRSGRTVLLTTHYMFEAEELCDRIGVITSGRMRALGTPGELKRHAQDRVVVEAEVYGVDEEQLDALRAERGVRGVTVDQRGMLQVIVVQCDIDGDAEPERFRSFVRQSLAHLKLGRVEVREPTLEDAYVGIVTGQEAAAPETTAVLS